MELPAVPPPLPHLFLFFDFVLNYFKFLDQYFRNNDTKNTNHLIEGGFEEAWH